MAGSREFFSKQHKAAREAAEQGLHVFPCAPNSKIPNTENGHKDATIDPAKIDAWWSEDPEANIGCAPAASGHFVVDLDKKEDADGEATLFDLEIDHGTLPQSYRVRTPSGGLHIWFSGSVPTTAGRLGPGVDTRGDGGYVLLPGSEIDDRQYSAEGSSDLRDIEPAPDWLGTEIEARKRDRERAVTTEVDTDANINRATRRLRDLVAAGQVAIEGKGGNDRTYRVACDLRDIGLSPDKAIELFKLEYNPHCNPPWTDNELYDETHSPILHAYSYGQNEVGSKGVGGANAFAGLKVSGQHHVSQSSQLSDFYPRDESEQDTRPDPEWFVPGWIQKQSTVMLYGQPGSYKSFLALDIALSISAGFPALGLNYNALAKDTVYAAGEGAIGIERQRRPAWRSARMIKTDRVLPFYTISAVPLTSDPGSVIQFIEAIEQREIKPSIVVLDTLARMMLGMNENDSADAGMMVEAAEAIKRRLGCTVLIVHHSGKDDERGPRGSGAFIGGFDTLIHCSSNKSAKIVTLNCIKQKDSEEPRPIHFKGRKVANSLVFDAITKEEADDYQPLDSRKVQRSEIGELLKEGGHYGLGDSITTRVLAQELLQSRDDLPADEEAAERTRRQMERALTKLAKGPLAAYIVSEPGVKPLQWALPRPDQD